MVEALVGGVRPIDDPHAGKAAVEAKKVQNPPDLDVRRKKNEWLFFSHQPRSVDESVDPRAVHEAHA